MLSKVDALELAVFRSHEEIELRLAGVLNIGRLDDRP